jgi:hypothetical protein
LLAGVPGEKIGLYRDSVSLLADHGDIGTRSG